MRERYGNPIAANYVGGPGSVFSETYIVRPHVTVSVEYGASGQPCAMLLRPENALHPLNNRSNTVGDSKQVKQVLSELVPDEERGKLVSDAALHITCGSEHPESDCGGSEARYEKVLIHHSGGRDTEHYATVVWTSDECKNTKPPAD